MTGATELAETGVGYLTWDQFERFRNAVNDSRKLIPWLRIAGYIRGGDSDELRHRSTDHPLGLSPTWLAAEEISNLLQEINHWPELEDVALHGYEFALTLTREVETAMAKWPYEDKPHRVQFIRCPSCHQMDLRHIPPARGGVQSVVKCRDRTCGITLTEEEFAVLAAIAKEEHERRLGDNAASSRTVR